MDNDTKKIVNEGKALKELVASEGYQIAWAKAYAKISQLIDISTLPDVSFEQLAVEIKGRKLAANIILSFFKDDIEGTVSQIENNNPLTLNEEEHIVRQ